MAQGRHKAGGQRCLDEEIWPIVRVGLTEDPVIEQVPAAKRHRSTIREFISTPRSTAMSLDRCERSFGILNWSLSDRLL